MQFSKRVSELSRLNNIDPKDVLFAILATSGASTAEAFAVIYRPAISTTSALSTKASQYIGQRPGLRKLIDELQAAQASGAEQPSKRRGRPRKGEAVEVIPRAEIDYTNKDEMLKEAWEQYQGATNEATKTKWYAIIVDLQRMKQEQNTAEEKKVTFYIPLSVERCIELFANKLVESGWDGKDEAEAVKIMRAAFS